MMKFALTFLILTGGFFELGFTEEKFCEEIRLNLNSKKISLCEDGIFLNTKDFGEVYLDNLQFDEDGFYTICCVRYSCSNCQAELNEFTRICPCCGFETIDFISLGNDQYLSTQEMLCLYFSYYSVFDENSLCAGEWSLSATMDSMGRSSLSGSVKYETENKNLDGEMKGKVQQDEDGKVEAEIEISAHGRF